MLKQQLAMTRRFIESSSHRHSSLVQSLGPPNYRYTTLEDTKEVKHTAYTYTYTYTHRLTRQKTHQLAFRTKNIKELYVEDLS